MTSRQVSREVEEALHAYRQAVDEAPRGLWGPVGALPIGRIPGREPTAPQRRSGLPHAAAAEIADLRRRLAANVRPGAKRPTPPRPPVARPPAASSGRGMQLVVIPPGFAPQGGRR
jgi:hypothetical protein